jgi:Ankyrin repeats (3 copies)
MKLFDICASAIIRKGIPTNGLPPLLVQKFESFDIEAAIETGILDLMIHFLPYKKRLIYDSIIDGSNVCVSYNYKACITSFLIWSAKKSGLLTKHIIEKLRIDNSRKREIQKLFPIACSYGHLDLVEYLADKFIDRVPSYMGEACANNHLNVVEYLVKRFNLTLADIKFGIMYRCEIEPYAACDGAPSVIRWVLEKFDPPVDFINKNNILKFACCGGIFKDVKYIVGKYDGAALRSHLVRRLDCLHNMYQNTNIMKYLVDNLFTTFNEHAKAFLLRAIEFENIQLMEYIINKFNLSIHDMGTTPCKPMAYKFLVEKFNLDAKFDYNNFCSHHLNLELVVFLTQKSIPSHKKKHQLLMDSSRRGHLDIVKYLLDTFNIDFDEDIFYGALEFAQFDVATYLVERWNVREFIYESKYCFHRLIYNLDTVKYLVETFPNYDIRHDNNFALRKACAGGSLDAVKYIVEKYNITVEEILNVDWVEFSALQSAVLNDKLEVVEYLVDKFNLSLDNFFNEHGDLELGDVHRYIRVAQYIIKKFNVKPYQITSKESFVTLSEYGVFKVSVA